MCTAAAIDGELYFPGPLALFPALGTVAVLLGSAAAPFAGVGVPLGSAPLQLLGRLSYSWYLWHWPVLVMAAVLAPALPVSGRLLCAAGALGLAAATYALIENPVRFHPRLMARPALSLGLAAALSVAGLSLALGMRGRIARINRTAPYRAIAAAAVDEPGLYAQGCLLGFTATRMRECVYGDSSSATTLVLFGDSHAAHWFPAVEHTAIEHGWRLVTLLKAGCPTADVPIYSPVAGRRHDQCARWRADALRRIAELRPSAVVLSNSLGYVMREGRADGYSRLSNADWQEGSRRSFARLHSAGVRVISLRDSPRPEWDIPVCLSRAEHRRRRSSVCTADRGVAVDEEVFAAERRAARGLDRVTPLDLSDLFCGPDVCEAVRGGLIVYRDHSHLTATYVRSIAPAVSGRLGPLVQVATTTR